MAASNPHVQVFHFTSRISSAKLAKYKLATERGMDSGNASKRAPTPTSNNKQPTPPTSIEPSSMEPPAKKARLKLSVRPPSESPDTIAVSRPKRDSSLRIRYSENMVVDDGDREAAMKYRPRPSPSASSGMSSFSARPTVEKEPTPQKEVTGVPAQAKDYSRDFMSYYVMGGEDEVEEVPKPPPKPEAPKQAPTVKVPRMNEAFPETKFRHHRPHANPPPTYPTPRLQPPRPPPPQPTVIVFDNTKKLTGPKEPDTVADMVKKLQALSTALTNFGGVPIVPKSPKQNGKDSKSSICPVCHNLKL